MIPPGERRALYGCFFVTGLTSLVCEVVWVRQLTLVLGATRPAVTVTLAAFMGGLAIGSAWIGRFVDRRGDPLRWLARLEGALAALIAATPLLLGLVSRAFAAAIPASALGEPRAWALRVGLSALVLLPPATLMGGTLPLLVKHLGTGGEVAAVTARLYAVNTAGAVAGSLLGVAAPHWLGLSGVVYAAAAGDAAVAVIALRLAAAPRAAEAAPAPAEKKKKKKKGDAAQEPSFPARPRLALVVCAFCGLAGLALEALWFRVLTLVIGSSAYAFGLMLATFLCGIALGSWAFARSSGRGRDPAEALAPLLIALAVALFASMGVYRSLPDWFRARLPEMSAHFGSLLLTQAGLCAAVLLLPAACLGAMFPASVRLAGGAGEGVGRRIGALYLANTAGSIAGSIAAPFALLPLLGTQGAIRAVALGCAAVGIVVFAVGPWPRGRKQLLAAGTIVGCAAALRLAPDWDPRAMTLGPYVNTMEPSGKQARDELVWLEEGADAIVSVHRSSAGELFYRANGKTEARYAGAGSTRTWAMLGHLPLLVGPRDDGRALLVGLGAGITLGAMLSHPVSRVDVVEIEPAVVRAARLFNEAHSSALDDPRVALHVTDGRAFLAADGERYDVIVSGVSDPWIRGVSSLFTVEYFRRVRERLAEGGAACVWLQNYRLGDADLKATLATLLAAFPEVSLWYDGRGPVDLFAIGSASKLTVDVPRLAERLAKSRAAYAPFGVRGPADVLATFLAGDADLRRFTAGSAPCTDERPTLELSLPLHQLEPIGASSGERMIDLLGKVEQIGPNVSGIDPVEYDMQLGSALSALRPRVFQARRLFERALASQPGHEGARRALESLKP